MNMNEKIKTNADRIRAMTDEEMAEKASTMNFLNGCSGCSITNCNGFWALDDCKQMCLAWLRSPVESEGETP